VRSPFETILDLAAGADVIRARSYGVIETVDGRFRCLRFRPFPKIVTLADVACFGRWQHAHSRGNRCRLYYNQPRGHRNFIALKYAVSTRDCTLATIRAALAALDDVARLKGTDALLADAMSWRISDRLLKRWGWHPHCPSRWHRHCIKRFYGDYPPSRFLSAISYQPTAFRQLLTADG